MLYIRTDMNERIATGHVMRCLSIADAAKEAGEDTIFILADQQAAELLEQRGYAYHILHTQWNHMDSEVPALAAYIKERKIERILIDSYQVTEPYLKQLSNMVQTYYIDDINAFTYPVTGMICYANYWKKFSYQERYSNAKLYLGPEYVPLRKEFRHCGAKNIKAKAENLLLMSGGSDTYGVLGRILESLDKALFQRIDVICGMYHTGYDCLKKKYQSHPNIRLHKAVRNLDAYMKEADLAVSAGGTTLYELCAVGTPAISYSIADNQLDNVRKFEEDGVIACAGDIRKDNVIDAVIRLIRQYQENQKLRTEISRKMQKLVDGKGAERIAGVLKGEKK